MRRARQMGHVQMDVLDTLLAEPGLTVREVIERTGRAQSRVYDAIARAREVGWVAMDGQRAVIGWRGWSGWWRVTAEGQAEYERRRQRGRAPGVARCR